MSLHIYRAERVKRVRRFCPCHEVLHYGSQHEFYDTTLIFFDCGASVDLGYGYWFPPKLYKKLTIFKDDIGYALMAMGNVISRAIARRRIRQVANYRLKAGGTIKEL